MWGRGGSQRDFLVGWHLGGAAEGLQVEGRERVEKVEEYGEMPLDS